MEIKVLGPLEARLNGRDVVPNAGKPRQVLALLALNAGRVVPVSTMVEELWGEHPPPSAHTTLQTYVMHVRRLLETALGGGSRGAKDVLVTRFGGYLLDVPAADVDAHEFERLAGAGGRAFDLGDIASACTLLRSAMTMWRGAVLVDVQAGIPLGMEVVRLQESRLSALEIRIDADLRMGRHHSLLSELAVLNAQHPMHENLCAKYMLALYRSGRQWNALDAYTTLRNTLVGELGVEPSGRLQHLRGLMLHSDTTLDRGGARELEMHLA